jgi:SAM-dependent methyltransferase
MREALAEAAAGLPVRPVAAAAEATGLPGGAFALVLVADALHWIDPELAGAEVGRLLAPGAAVAIVEAAPAATPFMRDLSALLARANPRSPPPSGRRRQLLALAGAGPARAEAFAQEAALDGAALDALLRSLSHVGPALSPGALDALLAEARALAERHGGARWARALTLTWARSRRP